MSRAEHDRMVDPDVCEHPRVTPPRARTVGGGGVQMRRQCLDCGEAVGGAIGRVEAQRAVGGGAGKVAAESEGECALCRRRETSQVDTMTN
jgi:hypothetical protein